MKPKGRGPKTKFEWVLKVYPCGKHVLTCTRTNKESEKKRVATLNEEDVKRALKLFHPSRRFLRTNCLRAWKKMKVRVPGDCSDESDDNSETPLLCSPPPSSSPSPSISNQQSRHDKESASARDKCNDEGEKDTPTVSEQLPEQLNSEDSALRELINRRRKLLEVEASLLRNSACVRELLMQVNKEIAEYADYLVTSGDESR